MIRWLRNYDRLRLDPNTPNEIWSSTKYDIEGMHWSELQQIFLPEIQMCWGPACSALKKSWHQFRMLGKAGQYRADIGFRINRIQRALGIPVTRFEGVPFDDEELSKEEIQLKREEQEDACDWEFD
jgi:hypothetical protein